MTRAANKLLKGKLKRQDKSTTRRNLQQGVSLKKKVTGPIEGLRHWPNQFSSPRPMAEPLAAAAGCLKKELAEGQLCKWPGKAPAARFRVAAGALQ